MTIPAPPDPGDKVVAHVETTQEPHSPKRVCVETFDLVAVEVQHTEGGGPSEGAGRHLRNRIVRDVHPQKTPQILQKQNRNRWVNEISELPVTG